MIDQNQASGLLGAALLFSGLFSPIFTSPVKGQIDYFQYNSTEAGALLFLAALALTFSLIRRYHLLLMSGIAICGTLALAFIKFQLFVSDVAPRWMGKFADSPYEGINRLVKSSFALDWGWGLLLAGAVLVLVAGRVRGYGDR